jgi:hypothetical protein
MGDGFQTLVAQPNFTCFKSNWEMSVTYFQQSIYLYRKNKCKHEGFCYDMHTHSYIRLPISKINTHTNKGRRRDHMVVGFMQSVPITTNVVRQDKKTLF